MKVTVILILALLTGCASITPESTTTEPTLYLAYEGYRHEVSKENIQASYTKYFSHDLVAGKNIENKEVVDQLLFKDYMSRMDSHHENIRGQKGCLTINGYDKEGMPLSFNIEYVPIDQRWLIRAIEILFVNDVHEFSQKGRCPGEYLN